MAKVNTVLGPLDSSDLGFTLVHEHVIVISTPVQRAYPEFLRRKETIERAVADLGRAHAEGVRTIIDVTPFDSGRDVEMLREVSRASGMQIVCATGCWLDVPRVLWPLSPDTVASLFIRDITKGIEDSGIMAGVIKVANDVGGVTPQGELILRAAARAQRATGVPITTHTWAPERVGDQQIKIFEEEGVDLKHVCIGHSNDTTDVEYLAGIMKKGAYLGLDRYPGGEVTGTPDWETRTAIVKRLIEMGYANRIMLSHDWDSTITMANLEIPETWRNANPDSYLFITRKVLPRLRSSGVPERIIREITVENPRRYFEGVA